MPRNPIKLYTLMPVIYTEIGVLYLQDIEGAARTDVHGGHLEFVDAHDRFNKDHTTGPLSFCCKKHSFSSTVGVARCPKPNLDL